jgi:DNA-binding transcriptional LysR family regulator
MNQLEMREVTYFVAVAEELHFGRAAERLEIAQPPLSRAIARLERRLGVPLFERTTRRVSLTAAGEVFLVDCRKVLAAMDTAVRRVQRARQPDRLTVAVRPGAGPGVLTDLLNIYSRQTGAVRTEIVFTYDEAAALRDGMADVALMCGAEGVGDLDFIELGVERPVALVPVGHRLAARSSLTIAELGELDTFTAEIPHEALDVIVDRVALGQLVVVVGESVLDRLGGSVTAVPVVDFPTTRLVLAWPPDTPHAARTQLIDTAGSRSRRHHDDPGRAA